MPGSKNFRPVYGQIFKKFFDSFKPKQSSRDGNFVGSDLNGNKFYEVAAEPEKGKRNPRRWFVPEKEMHFDVDNMSAEWDAWLRNKRIEPPTVEELTENLAIANTKKLNAEKNKLKDNNIPALPDKSAMHPFPQHKEYDVQPGKGSMTYKEEDYK